MSISEKEQQKNESLSAFMDAEQSDIETSQIVDALLIEPDYMEKFIRLQLVNDSLRDQTQEPLLNSNLQHRIAAVLEELPAHYVDESVNLKAVRTEQVIRSDWFRQLLGNKVVSGISVAASVMMATLFTLQHFESPGENKVNLNNNMLASSDLQAPSFVQTTSLIQASSELPAHLIATTAATTRSDNLKQQYRWIEADPELSRQVRQYINEYETHRAAYNLQPKVRAANYQFSE
ncbi:MAG: RseA family anti-sigma factor [Gammaproteobacteria bacterium]|nr:RseA family anti-sigma factor [Gammaproteobacteria bacterium]